MINRVLFVCTGNTCRSAMAKVIFKDKCTKEGIVSRVKSAGIYVRYPKGASLEAITAVARWDLDLRKHISSQITKNDILSSKIIITMTQEHKNFLINTVADIDTKIYTLNEYSRGRSKDIMDPFGGGLEAYFKSAEQLRDLINDMVIPEL